MRMCRFFQVCFNFSLMKKMKSTFSKSIYSFWTVSFFFNSSFEFRSCLFVVDFVFVFNRFSSTQLANFKSMTVTHTVLSRVIISICALNIWKSFVILAWIMAELRWLNAVISFWPQIGSSVCFALSEPKLVRFAAKRLTNILTVRLGFLSAIRRITNWKDHPISWNLYEYSHIWKCLLHAFV